MCTESVEQRRSVQRLRLGAHGGTERDLPAPGPEKGKLSPCAAVAGAEGGAGGLANGWKQEAVPRAKDDRQCKAKPWLHSKVCGRAEFFSGFVGCGEGEVKWGWPEGLSCFSGLCSG